MHGASFICMRIKKYSSGYMMFLYGSILNLIVFGFGGFLCGFIENEKYNILMMSNILCGVY
jgi:hypothetical protein